MIQVDQLGQTKKILKPLKIHQRHLHQHLFRVGELFRQYMIYF